MKMFCSTPPRTALDLSRNAQLRLGLLISQFSANTLLQLPEISLPMVTPPWPSRMVQPRMIRFTDGTPTRRPSDDQIYRRHSDAAAIGIATGFDGDAIVAGVEQAIFNQHVAAAFRVAAVVVRAVRNDVHTAHRDVGAKHRMDLPPG